MTHLSHNLCAVLPQGTGGAGVITEEKFNQKKAEMMARI